MVRFHDVLIIWVFASRVNFTYVLPLTLFVTYTVQTSDGIACCVLIE